MFRTIVLAVALAIGSGAAIAQTPATPKQDSAASQAEKKATSDKRAECKREAKAKKFGIHRIERKRFLDECMKR